MYILYNIKFYVLFFMFFSGMLIFCSMYNHLLLTLLGLEYLVLCIFLFFMFFIMNMIDNMYVILIFLTFSVCEGVLGLSILVSIIRSHGNDHVNSIF
uniref:NADH-ubiquinone oxidoreductase chain 4L n=1 Tax=Onomaus tenuis TaxID=2813422 RepID=A0A8T9ZYE1_9HEMI|nr:NADH dehydrogenase subunit 4L [Onomaus tenuis]